MPGIIYLGIALILLLILTSIKKTKDFIVHYLSEFLTAIAAIGMTIVDIMSDSQKIFFGKYTWEDSWVLLLLLFSIIMIASIIVSANRNLHNRTVKDEILKNEKLKKSIDIYKNEYYKLCSNNILSLFKDFFSNGNERISIYKFNDNHFILLGRYSKTPAYNKKTDYEYSINEGLIGKGWQDGSAFISGAPKWTKANKKAYNNFMKQRCDITDKRLNQIKMKSQSLYIKTLHDNNTAEDPDGIIVFESMNPTKVTIQDCENLITDKNKELLLLLKNMKSLTKKIQ